MDMVEVNRMESRKLSAVRNGRGQVTGVLELHYSESAKAWVTIPDPKRQAALQLVLEHIVISGARGFLKGSAATAPLSFWNSAFAYALGAGMTRTLAAADALVRGDEGWYWILAG